MRNVTVTLEEDVARWARVWAAKHDTSVSRLLGELLKERMQAEQGYEQAMQEFLSKGAAPLKETGSYPNRDHLHERNHLS